MLGLFRGGPLWCFRNRFAGSAPMAAVGAFVIATLLTPLPSANDEASIDEAQASEIATDAWLYGYPLVAMELTRRVMTNVAVQEGKQAPMGQWAHQNAYPPPTTRTVAAPNADTIFSLAWLDLAREPYILSIPDSKGRYYLLPILDAWTNVCASIGQRTTGTHRQVYAITGPSWKGVLPGGVTECKAATDVVWLLGRIYCNGSPEDYAAVHAFQANLSLVPLSFYGKRYNPPPGRVDPSIDMATPVRDQVNRMDPGAFFRLMAALMKRNPPAAIDAPLLRRMVKIGLAPGRDFDISRVERAVAMAIQEGPRNGIARMVQHFAGATTEANGWSWFMKLGAYGADYEHRAFTAAIGIGANLPQDAIYPVTEADPEGNPYRGNRRYLVHFPKKQLPPVNGFWSLALYDGQYFFAANPRNRFILGSHDRLRYNPDGSLDILIQHDAPGVVWDSNWLPAPDGDFVLMLRLYWVRENDPTILSGSWRPPPVRELR